MSEYTLVGTLEDVEQIAEDRGCTVFYPTDMQLTLDIDSIDAYNIFLGRFKEFYISEGGEVVYEELLSGSGGNHKHVIITTRNHYNHIEQIALQFALGSDKIRETLNLWRHYSGIEKPIRLFRPK